MSQLRLMQRDELTPASAVVWQIAQQEGGACGEMRREIGLARRRG